MTEPADKSFDRIKRALRKGAVDRNAKTALALGAAMSGAVVSLPALAVTTTGVLVGLCYVKFRKKKKYEEIGKLNIVSDDDF